MGGYLIYAFLGFVTKLQKCTSFGNSWSTSKDCKNLDAIVPNQIVDTVAYQMEEKIQVWLWCCIVWTVLKTTTTWHFVFTIICTVMWGNIEQQGDIEQSYLFHGNSLIIVCNSHVASCLFVRLVTKKVSAPHPQNSPNVPTIFNLFYLNNNFQKKKNW